jgi:SpoVK/Ycf46/Vps4 family AAA+-type ATPase
LVSALLALLDSARKTFFEAPVVFVGATNMLEVIDGAILRPGRLDVHVFVGPPDEAARRTVIESYIHRRWAAWIGELQHPATQADGDGAPAYDASPAPTATSAAEEERVKQAVIDAFLAHSAGLTGAEIKNALNQFALDVVIGGHGAVPPASQQSAIGGGLEALVRKCCDRSRGSA